MSFTVVALLMSAWGMGLGFLMYRYVFCVGGVVSLIAGLLNALNVVDLG